ncbi:uncharacterized protein [Montipora foliosa]|uniref:uncharacterized protein n=1 Tax=Montipora foliosa TaxID=591990 RepID=UPI0035F1C387
MSTSESASDSEVDSLSESSINEDLEGETTEEAADVTTEEEDDGVIYTYITPYEGEPLAEEDDDRIEECEEVDIDGLSLIVLEARYEIQVPVNSWCQCQHCKDENLVGAREFRCCREVIHASGKMSFDGSMERISCITQHEDYGPLTNRTVLLQVAPLLKDKDGRPYRRQPGVPENEFIRAVAYRWTICWLCGYMGWDNTRPLSACISHNIRTCYQTLHRQTTGYRNA